MGIASLVLAIIAFLLSTVGFFLGPTAIVALVLSVLGIIFGGIAIAKKVNRGPGIAGLVISILAFLYSWIPAIIWIIAITAVAAV